MSSTTQRIESNKFKLHQLIWKNKVEEIELLLQEKMALEIKYRGLTPLQLAVSLGRKGIVEILLQHGSSSLTNSDLGFSALQEAVAYGNREMIKMMLKARHQELAAFFKSKKESLSKMMMEVGDFYMEMHWDFHSWIPLVSRLCPNDTYKFYKQGTSLRIDTTLIGFEKLKWVRGNVSFLFKMASDGSASFHILEHDKKIFDQIDKTKTPTAEELEDAVNMQMNVQMTATRLRGLKSADGIKFQRARSGIWGFRHDKTDIVAGYEAKVYHVNGLRLESTIRSEHLNEESRKKLQKLASKSAKKVTQARSSQNEEYEEGSEGGSSEDESNIHGILKDAKDKVYQHCPSLAPPPAPSISFEEYFSEEADGEYFHLNRPLELREKSKKITGTVWMAEESEFPLSFKQLDPIISVLSASNEHLERFQEMVHTTLPPGFPIQIEIPILSVLTGRACFSYFGSLQDGLERNGIFMTPHFFEIPPGYSNGIVIKNILKRS